MLTTDVGLVGFAAAAGMQLPWSEFAPIERDLNSELASISLFDDALSTIAALSAAGLKVGVCSNLAAPYAVPVRVLLPHLDSYSWSFEVGAAKPDPRIYQNALSALGVDANQALFVGDTPEADLDGPVRFGLHACLVDRARGYTLSPSFSSLVALRETLLP